MDVDGWNQGNFFLPIFSRSVNRGDRPDSVCFDLQRTGTSAKQIIFFLAVKNLASKQARRARFVSSAHPPQCLGESLSGSVEDPEGEPCSYHHRKKKSRTRVRMRGTSRCRQSHLVQFRDATMLPPPDVGLGFRGGVARLKPSPGPTKNAHACKCAGV